MQKAHHDSYHSPCHTNGFSPLNVGNIQFIIVFRSVSTKIVKNNGE